VVGDDDFRQRVFAGREGDYVTAFDEPDIRVISAAGHLLRAEDLEKLGMEGALIQQEG
jgi:hypothetical protein